MPPLPRPAPGTLRWWVVGSIGIAAGTAMAVWFGISATSGQVSWVDTGYRHVDSRTLDVEYDLYRPAGSAVTCTVRALDVHHGTVGSTQVTLPPTGEDASHQTTRVRTTTPAVSGEVQSCALAPTP